jgi:hypothetical protein
MLIQGSSHVVGFAKTSIATHYNVYCVTRGRACYVDVHRNDNILRLPLIFMYYVRCTTYYMPLNYSSFLVGIPRVYLRDFIIAFPTRFARRSIVEIRIQIIQSVLIITIQRENNKQNLCVIYIWSNGIKLFGLLLETRALDYALDLCTAAVLKPMAWVKTHTLLSAKLLYLYYWL